MPPPIRQLCTFNSSRPNSMLCLVGRPPLLLTSGSNGDPNRLLLHISRSSRKVGLGSEQPQLSQSPRIGACRLLALIIWSRAYLSHSPYKHCFSDRQVGKVRSRQLRCWPHVCVSEQPCCCTLIFRRCPHIQPLMQFGEAFRSQNMPVVLNAGASEKNAEC